MSFQDKTLTCVDCGQTFVFTAGEQEFYAQKGFQNAPKRCKSCKATKRSSGPGGGMDGGGSRELFEVVCSSCGQKTTVPFKPTVRSPRLLPDLFPVAASVGTSSVAFPSARLSPPAGRAGPQGLGTRPAWFVFLTISSPRPEGKGVECAPGVCYKGPSVLTPTPWRRRSAARGRWLDRRGVKAGEWHVQTRPLPRWVRSCAGSRRWTRSWPDRRRSSNSSERYPRWAVLEAVREVLAACRKGALAGDLAPAAAGRSWTPIALRAAVERVATRKAGSSLRPVINATGVVLHTNLGRAPLAPSALAAVEAAARGYSNLEFDLATGARGSRQVHVEQLLCTLTGAEAALAVNNNAAAVLLGVNTFADGREVVISRGELVEIGDAFRIPDVMTRAGGRLREVGTTNRTHLADYEQALGPETGLILKVHRSNFQLLGFTADVETAELVTLAKRRGIPVMEDLGSGALLDLSAVGLRREPMAADAIRAGVDLVTFSGDKLLGGPQAGMLVGRRDLLARLRRNPAGADGPDRQAVPGGPGGHLASSSASRIGLGERSLSSGCWASRRMPSGPAPRPWPAPCGPACQASGARSRMGHRRWAVARCRCRSSRPGSWPSIPEGRAPARWRLACAPGRPPSWFASRRIGSSSIFGPWHRPRRRRS